MIIQYFIFCLLLRFILAIVPLYVKKTLFLKIYSILLFGIGIGFAYQYFMNTRKIGAFGQIVWWHNLRALHSLTFLASSYFITRNQLQLSSKILLGDVIIGIFAFIQNHQMV